MEWRLPSGPIPDYPGLSLLQGAVLHQRGIGPEEASRFLAASIDDLHDPSLLKDGEKAVEIVEGALAANVPITIYGDYDCDGVTSTALLVEALTKLGGKVDWYINSRFVDGYGMQVAGVEEIASRGLPRLIITCDNGITAYEGVARARGLGMDVVVTDHHEPGEDLPDALAVLNPKRRDCPYPYKGLAGVGVAFKLMQLLYRRAGREREALRLLDLVALGTVADVMPLTGENRIFVKNGLKLINWGEKSRVGFQALQQVLSIDGDVNSHFHLGYLLGPLMNAKGRLEGPPDEAVELLQTRDRRRAGELADTLQALNGRRQVMTREQGGIAQELVDPADRFLVLHDSRFHEGIIGLIASRMKEKYYRPVVVLADDHQDPTVLKGSARSIPGFSLKEHLIDGTGDILLKGGGHDLAAGLSIKRDDLNLLKERLNRLGDQILTDEMLIPVQTVDYLVEPGDLSEEMVEQIGALAPFGPGFSQPVLQMTNFLVEQSRYMGSESQHLKMIGHGLEAVAFQQGDAYRQAGEPRRVELLGLPEINQFRGRRSLQFRVINRGWRSLDSFGVDVG